MSTRRVISSTSSSAAYIIALVVIVVAFLLLGGAEWLKDTFHGSASVGATINMANWNWAQILISLVIGFLIGLLASGKRL